MRGKSFWNEYRQVQLTKSEGSMNSFVKNIKNIKGFKYFMIGLDALIENSIEIGEPNPIDLTPVNTILPATISTAGETVSAPPPPPISGNAGSLVAITPTAGAATRTITVPISTTRSSTRSIPRGNIRNARSAWRAPTTYRPPATVSCPPTRITSSWPSNGPRSIR